MTATSENRVKAVGNWTPKDSRDLPVTPDNAVANGPCPTCTPAHTLRDKSIAIQKGVGMGVNVGPAGYTPGDRLLYTLDFQVSDFFSFQDVVVTDVISDGQHFDTTYAPRLTIAGNTYTLAAADFQPANFDVACDYSGGAKTECTIR